MARYIPTIDGLGVVDASEGVQAVRVLAIRTAEVLLQGYRKSAWEEASRPGACGYVANCFNAWANNLSDALALAAKLRAAAQIVDRSAA